MPGLEDTGSGRLCRKASALPGVLLGPGPVPRSSRRKCFYKALHLDTAASPSPAAMGLSCQQTQAGAMQGRQESPSQRLWPARDKKGKHGFCPASPRPQCWDSQGTGTLSKRRSPGHGHQLGNWSSGFRVRGGGTESQEI